MLFDIDGKGQSDISFGNKAEIIETRTARRILPLHFGVNYSSSPLQFKLLFGREHPFDRFEMEEVSYWLTGHQEYQWLTINQPDLEHVQFRCLITDLTPITSGWIPYAFEATVQCDCPYAYSYPYERTYSINGSTDIVFHDDGTVREYSKPDIHFVPTGKSSVLRIVNKSDDGRIFEMCDIPDDCDITVENTSGIIAEANHGYNLYSGFNMRFFRTVHGDNFLHIEGSGKLTFSGRFFRNVAG